MQPVTILVICGVLMNLMCYSPITALPTNNLNDLAPRWTNARMTLKPKPLHAEPSGNTVVFRCRATGDQPLQVSWLKDGIAIGRNSRVGGFKFRQRSQLLQLSSVTVADDGLYQCVVSNRHGSINYTYELDVQERAARRPILQFGTPMNKTAKVGSNVTFRCVVYSDQHPHIQWLKDIEVNGSTINPMTNTPYVKILKKPGRHSTLKEMETLTVKNVSLADAGMYTCLAGNSIDMSHSSAWLTVIPGRSEDLIQRLVSVIQTESAKNRQTWQEIADRMISTLTDSVSKLALIHQGGPRAVYSD